MQSRDTRKRVFASIKKFLNKRLKLGVNEEKSAMARYHERGFLEFGFTSGKTLKIQIIILLDPHESISAKDPNIHGSRHSLWVFDLHKFYNIHRS